MTITKLETGNQLRSKITALKAKFEFLEKQEPVKLLSIQIDELGKPLETVNFTKEDGLELGNIKFLIKEKIDLKLKALEEEFNNL